jgi:hypothetical protein
LGCNDLLEDQAEKGNLDRDTLFTTFLHIPARAKARPTGFPTLYPFMDPL